MICFFVVGNDKRTLYIKEMLSKEGKVVKNIDDSNYILAPTPFTKDNEYVMGTDLKIDNFINMCIGRTVFAGVLPSFVKEKFKKLNIKYFDLMEYEDVSMLNAIPTAEGAIEVAMQNTDITLSGSKVLILGYGRIGKTLAKMLQGIGANVYCEARKEKDLAQIQAMGYNYVDLKNLNEYLSYFDYIFSTVPSLLLDKNRLNIVKNGVCIVDLASKPGSIDFEYAKEQNLNVIQALSLPSKVAPKSAAKYFKQKIDELI